MAMQDKVNNKAVRSVHKGTVATLASAGSVIDRLGFGALTVVVDFDDKSVGTTAVVKFQDCETADGTFVDVEAKNTIYPYLNDTGVISASHNIERYGYLGDKRYVKVVVETSSSATTEEVSIYALLEDPTVMPTN